MNVKTIQILAGIAVLCPHLASSAEPQTRPEWDQQKATAMVQKIIATEEKQGQPWDKIAWMTNVSAAVARAQKEAKPIFLYFSVIKGGPAAAPC